MRSTIKELLFFTFGKEAQSRNICKLHRYLSLNLASYVQSCVVQYPDFEPIEDPEFDESTLM